MTQAAKPAEVNFCPVHNCILQERAYTMGWRSWRDRCWEPCLPVLGPLAPFYKMGHEDAKNAMNLCRNIQW